MTSTPPLANILVVDDEAEIRALIGVMLELQGHTVVLAENGERALELAAASDFDLITLDVMMPGLDGWQVADALDADPHLTLIPRIMVSGMPLAQLEAAPGSGRAAAILSKPFDFVAFTELVTDVLEARPARPA